MNIDPTSVICIGIPLMSFTYSIMKTNAYIAVQRELRMTARKKPTGFWRQRDGQEISLSAMEDSHLANAIKMVARNHYGSIRPGKLKDDSSFKKLCREAKSRGFKVSILTTPFLKNGRYEYVEVWTPQPRSKLAAIMRPVDLDSRPQE